MNLLSVNLTIAFISSITLIGVLIASAFLLSDINGALSKSALRLASITKASATIWFLASSAQIVLTFSNILGGSISDALDFTSLKSYVTQVGLGQFQLIQWFLILVVLVAVHFLRRVLPAALLLILSLLALAAPVFQSHAASDGSHSLAIGSLVIHVIGISLWVGGLIAIALIHRDDRTVVLPRFSAMALWAAIAVVVSGILNSLTRIKSLDSLSSDYGLILIAKVFLTSILLLLGYLNRKSLSGRSDSPAMVRIISVEIAIMSVVLFLGSWLSNTEPPTTAEAEYSPALSIVGLDTPEEPTLWRVISLYNPDALMIGLLVTATALYIKGVITLKKRGDSWPVGRTIAFAIGIAAIDFATSGGLGVYALFSFQYHMIAHMLLGMVAPIGLVLGAPITLALRTLPQGRNEKDRGMRGTLIAALHSKPAIIITNPVSALAIFDGSLFLLYFTDLFGILMNNHAGHLLMNIHFILAGFLFFNVIIGIDPNPKKVPYIVRIVILFAAMSIHAFFSIALMSTTTLIDGGLYQSLQTPWLTDLLADQYAGGAVGWAMGEIPILLALIATFTQWNRDDSREAKRIDRNEARMAAMGEPDELAQYNNYLNQLRVRDEKEGLK
ncbi:Cytochrome c oxidase caa3-type, assembly factor CtaG-related [Candidatus Nanopelagicaceae bacterium]